MNGPLLVNGRSIQQIQKELRGKEMVLSASVARLEEAVSDHKISRALKQVDEALLRIEAGTYGLCSVCGGDIDAARLEIAPWTLYCEADKK